MRDIKFRLFDKANKKMFYSDDGQSGSNGIIDFVRIYTGYSDSDEWKEYTDLMQYTGLNTMNDKPIYEGDICKAELNKEDLSFDILLGEVSFFLGQFVFTSGRVIYPLNQFSCHYQAERCFIQVIGNIYENPELIKGA